MCSIERIIDLKPSSMPDLGISLDTVFYPGFDISITNDRVRVLFFITDSKSEMKMRIVKELRSGVAYNRARNELYVWFTDDELLKMKGHTVLVEVEVSDIFTNGLAYSTIETINVDPIIKKRCTYSTSFNDSIVNDLRSDGKFIKLDKTKSKPWVRPSERYKVDHNDSEYKKFLDFCRYGDCNQNAHDDRIDALRYASKKWLKEKHDIIGNVTDVYFTPNGLEFNVVPCNNHDTREKEKLMKTKKDIDRIVITKNDLNEVLLRAYSGDEIVEKTIAKCNPNDIFDFNIGAKLSVDRLYDGYDMTPKPKRKPYNGKIFVARYPGWGLRENTLYSVTNGIINECLFGKDPFIYCDMSDEALSAAIYHNVYGSHGTDEMAKCSAYFVEG